MLKILVINLESAQERMAFQRQQLSLLGLEFERFPAYQIKDNADPIYIKYHSTWQRHLSRAEVSCFYSHKLAWERTIIEDQPIMILEDDALLATNLAILLEKLENLSSVDYINLEARGSNKKKQLAKQANYAFSDTEVFRMFQGRSGTGGYIIWPKGAKKLLAKMETTGIGSVDKFINSCYELASYQLDPAPLIQIDQCKLHGITPPIIISSSIGARPKQPKPLSLIFWIYLYRRLAGQLKIGLNQLSNMHRAKRRNIAISKKLFK